jgi:hypothetical protein
VRRLFAIALGVLALLLVAFLLLVRPAWAGMERRAEAVDLTAEGRKPAAPLTASGE